MFLNGLGHWEYSAAYRYRFYMRRLFTAYRYGAFYTVYMYDTPVARSLGQRVAAAQPLECWGVAECRRSMCRMFGRPSTTNSFY